MARRVSFIISAKNRGFIKALDQSARRMDRFGRKMQRMGRTLTRNITMPVAAAGGAAVKMASDFESSLSRAQAQADLTAEQVSFIGEAAKETAKRTGEATDDIIEAYKFTLSAGMNLAESQKIVSAAAEAAAAGFGTQKDLVRLTTTAMQAYNDEIDSGRQFMDLLVGAAQKMELEVSKLGPAFQRNVGVAKELNIGMRELLAGIGSVSEIMGDAQRGGRLFQTMITKLLRPTAEAKVAIEGVFGSIRNMRESITQEGLLNTMVRLRNELEATSEEGLGLVFSQRSLEAALNFTNREGDRTNEILQNMGDTAGAPKSAFDDVSDTTERRFLKALRSVQVAAIEIGTTLLPIAEDIIRKVQEWVTWFSNLSEESKKAKLRQVALAAAAGPVLNILGSMVRVVSGVVGGLTKLVPWLRKTTGVTLAMSSAMKAVPWVAFGTLAVATANKARKIWQETKRIGEEVDKLFAKDVENESWRHLEERAERIRQKMVEINRLTNESASGFGGAGLTEEYKKLADELDRVKRKLNELKPFGMFQHQGGDPMIDSLLSTGGGGPLDFRDPEGVGRAEESRGGAPQEGGGFGSMLDHLGKIPQVAQKASMGIMRLSGTTNRVGRNLQDAAVKGAELSDVMANNLWKATNDVSQRWQQFGEVMGQVLSQAILHGRELGQVLKNIGAQLASRALMKGLGLLLSGGTFQLGSFIGSVFGVNDALITSEGDVVQFHPDDNILAMKDFSNLGGGGDGMANVNVFMDGWLVDRQLERLNTKRSR